MATNLSGRVYALICRGDETDRAIAVAIAEAGGSIAIATISPSQQEEFATASIANEAWAIGADQFSAKLDASDGAAVQAFAEEVQGRLGRCDGVILGETAPASAIEAFHGAVPRATSLRISSEASEPGAVAIATSASETASAVVARLG